MQAAGDGEERVRNGLLALYDFSAAEGEMVLDRSGVGSPVDLKISEKYLDAVSRTAGSLELHSPGIIRGPSRAAKIADAIRITGEVTVEVWLESPPNASGRFIAMAPSNGQRNFAFGQKDDRFELIFRTTRTGTSGGDPLTVEHTADGGLTHFVYTRDRTGRTRVFLNGELRKEVFGTGSLEGFERFPLTLGNESSADEPWLGTFHLVAFYGRDLLAREVLQNYQAGANFRAPSLADSEDAPAGELFKTKIAPLLSAKCLECHDSSSKSGGLDLSKYEAVLTAGKGTVLTPGDADASKLVTLVDSEKMPLGRAPLRAEEKKLLREWIDGGAEWTLETLVRANPESEESTIESWVQRLTVPEYVATVRGALGVDISAEAAELLPPDARADGFKNTAYNLNVDLQHVASYAQLAQLIVGKIDAEEFARGFGEAETLTADALEPLIAKMGSHVLRAPLEEEELSMYKSLASAVADAGGDFQEVARYLLEAMLQSPRLLYRIEGQRGDGTAWPVGEYELASRLSYIIWGASPDEELLSAAHAGELHDPKSFDAQVERMLADPRAVERSTQFISEWLDLDRLANLQPSEKKFPAWDAKLAKDMREETLAFFREVAWEQQRPLVDLLNAQFTYATPELARHYGIAPQGQGSQGQGLRRYDLSGTPSRGGLLTHGSVLTMGGDEASMVTRGLFVLTELLLSEVGNPPPGLDTPPPPSSPGRSHRAISMERVESPACGGCHSRFEPLAFGLEKFDGVGAYHEKDEHGNALREDGKVLFPGAGEAVEYKTSAELMDMLAGSERVRQAIIRKLTQFALGRPLGAADEPSIDRIVEATSEDRGAYGSLITALVKSDLVQTMRTEPVARD